jgi:diguanylate cyclase (GGDEF)-like protein
VHDNLTGLPNRQLFIDRLNSVAMFAKTTPNLRPTVMVIDLDRFKQVNDPVGIAVGDSILLTLARRLAHPQAAGHTGPPRGRPVRPDPHL